MTTGWGSNGWGFGPSEDDDSSVLDILVADTLAITDSPKVEILFNGVTVSDELTLSDQLVVQASYVRVPSVDTIAVVDSLVRDFTEGRTASDSITITEQLVNETVFLTDTVSLTDSVTTSTDNSQIDLISISDTVVRVVSYVRSVSDTLSVTDNASTIFPISLNIVINDTPIAVTDSVLAQPLQGRDPFDAVVVTEQLIKEVSYARFIADAVATTDSLSLTGFRDTSDTISVGDSLVVQTTKGAQASDSVAITDQVTVTGTLSRVLFDVVFLADAVTRGTTAQLVLSDAIAVTDQVSTDVVNIDVYLSDAIVLTDSVSRQANLVRVLADTIAVTDNVQGQRGDVVDRAAADTITITDIQAKTLLWPTLEDSVKIFDSTLVEFVGEFPIVTDADGFGFHIQFKDELSYNHVGDLGRYQAHPVPGSHGVPFEIEEVHPVVNVFQSGSMGRAVNQNDPNFLSNVFRITGSDPVATSHVVGHDIQATEQFEIFDLLKVELLGSTSSTVYSEGFNSSTDVGRYINLSSGRAPGIYRIMSVASPTQVVLDKPLQLIDPVNGNLTWSFTTGINGLGFRTTNKITNQSRYHFSIDHLEKIDGNPFSLSTDYTPAGINGPRVVDVDLTDEGVLIVQYDQEMRADREVVSPDEYAITGPSIVRVRKITSDGPTDVAVELDGLIGGSYTLNVNFAGTPKDLAGNPIDPAYSQAIFTGNVPLTNRSVFTDKGPIAKSGLTMQTGINATINSVTEITLPGATLTPSLIGMYLTLTGSSHNNGTYKIVGIVSPTKARVQASFALPDPNNAAIAWEVLDPRNGEIADDPSDVEVKVNGNPVVPEAVIGLLGQVVLATPPLPTDDVKINYSWCSNPTVDFRRLNSKEFRLNSWNNDAGYSKTLSQHKYRYNNTLVRPGDFESDDLLATLDQPENRNLYYRAYERAYTATLNDPGTLLLNSPIHKIAFPPAQRTINEQFVSYEANTLPEASNPPWVRHGVGTSTVTADLLTVTSSTAGTFPTGQPIFWTQEIDLTFPHAFALSWRFYGGPITASNGVFTGLAAGYSDEESAFVVGFLQDGSTKKIGFLKRGFADDPSVISSWVGGLDSLGVPTEAPVAFDWSILHSYRIFRDHDGTVRLYVDGDIGATLLITPSEAPFLEELNAPFDEIQGVFFGSVSREAKNVSTWDFIRYLILPTNPLQTSPSSYINYEGSVLPEVDNHPWTPIGFHGTETIVSNQFLLLDSTSATDAVTASEVGLIGGDYKGFVRLEPLFSVASNVVMDLSVQLRTQTHGIDPYGLMAAVDDGSRLIQLAFFPHLATPKFSYGGRSLPGDFSPYVWGSMGTASGTMAGRVLKISDTVAGDGLVYYIEDLEPFNSDSRVVANVTDYMYEFRNKVISFTVDGSGFAGAFGQVDDGSRAVGLMFEVISGTKYVTFNSDGVSLGSSARFAFNWGDNAFHTYRFSKSTGGDLVTLFIDGTFVGSVAYSAFSPTGGTAVISFGSSTPSSVGSLSQVEWAYCNVWRIRTDLKHYVGIWKGFDNDSLTGYHMPLKASGRNAQIVGNALGDSQANFITANVVSGDLLVVDDGLNKGAYEVAGVSSSTTLTIVGLWPSNPTQISYRIVKEIDWTTQHRYRMTRDSSGLISVFFDTNTDPLFQVGYNSIDLPTSGTGIVKTLSNGLAAVAFGSFNSENLEQSSWDFVRYGVSRTPTELVIAPHHQFLNQRNVMESPERLSTIVPHTLTDFWSSSTGIVPKQAPEFLGSAGVPAYTQLNDSTPLVPSTQTYQVRHPTPTRQFVSALNDPADTLNSSSGFVLNDGSVQYKLLVPNDVLYSALDVIEQTSGEEQLLAPFGDDHNPAYSGVQYVKEVCLDYVPNTLPENDVTAPTPWTRQSDVPGQVTASVSGGVLTYSTAGSRTVYRNNTTLPDAPGLQTVAKFRLRLADDATNGTGDTMVRFGLSAPGLTVALAFITTPLAERYVLIMDLNNGNYLGSVSFDFLDGAYHTYKITRDPGAGLVRVSIDS